MSTSTINSAVLPPAPPATGEHRQHERTIQKQLARTSFHVRLVDLAASVAVLLVGVLAFLLATALVDHWLMPLGAIGRTLALVALAGGSLAYLVLQVGPLLVKAINPTYAARTIEEATPSLKNSLINFLLLKQDRAGVKEVVFEAVEAKAAADIAFVPVEHTVDRSRLIYAGYVLCGVMAVFAAYKILSPKDPFQTIARVVLPWADIARPSRVQIADVEPGDAEVYHGQVVAVSAIVHGADEGDPVTLLFSTADGQTVDRAVEMALTAGGLRYECKLPPSGQEPGVGSRESGGIQQELTYRIIAGDAESPTYQLKVVAAPTIIVEKLAYQFPAYTKKPPQTVPQQGDIHALEGTRVTIHAVANQPIKSAYLELDPGVKDVPPELLALAVDGTRAWGTLVLALKADRHTPWHASYQVRFYNDRGQRSQQPILHKIEVIRDLPPEVQILQPQKVRVEVPLDGEQTIEVRGVDPDFGLSSLRLEGSIAGDRVLNIELLDGKSAQPPQATVPYAFRPRDHKLVVGDELKYAAIAADNRANSQTSQSEPNIARTAEYTLVVVAPRGGEGDKGPGTGDKPQEPGAGGQESGTKNQEPGAGKPPGDKPNDPQARSGNEGAPPSKPDGTPSSNPNSGEKTQPMPSASGSKPESGSSQSGQPEKSQPEKSQPEKSQPDKSQPQSGTQQRNSGSSQGSSAGKKNEGTSGSQDQGQGASSQGGAAGSQAGSPQGNSPTSEDGQSASSGQGSAGGKPSGNSQSPSGQQGDAPADASGSPSGAGGKPEKAHEGQLVEELLKQAQKEQGTGSRGQGTGSSGQESGDKSQEPGAGNQKPGSGNQQGGKPGQSGTKPEGTQPPTASESQPGSKPEGTQARSPSESSPSAGNSNSGQPSSDPSSTGKPAPADPKAQPGQGTKSQGGEKPDPQNRLPGENQGQNPSQQPGSASSGGAPQGPSKTDKGQESPMSQGEKRDPGAGQNGAEGAGSKGAEKTGSGQGQEANRDKPKTQQPEGGSAQPGEPSPPSGSKRQSDSQGGQSGDQSGGGKQGAGQSAGQEGSDSPGSKSAADQGAGAANQTGSGQTGSKAGGKEPAPGQTGQSGNEAGDGSSTRSGEGDKPGKSKPGQQPGEDSAKGGQKPKSDSSSTKAGNSAGGPIVNGGGDGNRPVTDYGPSPEVAAGEAANLEYTRKATDLALQKLRDQEHNPDPELLSKLGWTKDDLAEFLRRWDGLKKSAANSEEGKRELDDALKSLGLRDPANRKRAGSTTSDNQRDLRDGGDRTAPPASYRDLFDAFRKGAARSAK